MSDVRHPVRHGAALSGDHSEDIPGLVWAYGFDGDGIARGLTGTGIREALGATEGWVWLHFNLADTRGRAWIDEAAPIPDSAKELLLEADDHLCLIAEDDSLMGVFADFRRELDHDTHDIARLKFALHRRVLLTGRRQALQSVDEVRRALRSGLTFESGEALLEQLFDTFAAQVATMTRELARRLEAIEDRVVDDAVDPEDLRVGPIRRTALRLSRQVGALRLHFTALVDNPERELPEDVFAMTERVALRLTSIGRDVEAIQERARIIQEEAAAKSAAHMNRQLQVLSALTALFLPATLVTGLFGMNTHGLPFGADETGFWWATVVAALGSGVVYLVLKRMGIMK
ncbi:CorA family divalent cation transporter [Pinisolibacter sp.]|uniref:CorA family divalent cation transporter n=1 Tax=Pinisolibacter sp. TaxID=2172024 RepID=UPI002FDEF4AD